MVSLGLRWGSICQQTALARKILWHRGWVRSLPSTEHYKGVYKEAMKPVHASAFLCLLLWRIILMLQPSSWLVLFRSSSSTQLPFLSSADLAGKLGTSTEKSFLSLFSLPQHHPRVWLWNSEIPYLILSVPWSWPDIFISLWCSGCWACSTQNLGAGFPWQEPGELPTAVMRKKDGESQPDSVTWIHYLTVIRNLTAAWIYMPFTLCSLLTYILYFLSIFFSLIFWTVFWSSSQYQQ